MAQEVKSRMDAARKTAEKFADAHPNIALSIVVAVPLAILFFVANWVLGAFAGTSIWDLIVNAPPVTHLIPICAIALYFPFVVYSDLRARAFHPKYYTPLALMGCISLMVYFMESPLRNYYLFVVVVGLCLLFFLLSLIRIIGFSDAVLISLVLLIMQYNPLTKIRIFFPLDYFWCLMILTCAMPIFTWVYNRRTKKRMGVIDMLTHMRDHFPYTLLVFAAFFITIFAEVIM